MILRRGGLSTFAKNRVDWRNLLIFGNCMGGTMIGASFTHCYETSHFLVSYVQAGYPTVCATITRCCGRSRMSVASALRSTSPRTTVARPSEAQNK
jgi:uncharacterized membrane protein YkvI